jgi:hydrogenase maturation factor
MMTTVPLRRSTKTKAPPPPVEGSAEDLAAAALSLARRFADGATMWCVAPAWPSHARHVAVEFVHPVVVGTRALPAVSLDAATAVETVRALARPGDALLGVSTADDPVAHDLLARADAWGLTSVWLGAGPRPQTGADTPAARHVVWIDEADPAVAARSGQLVLLYHLLWELTHVVFEHPGLLVPESGNGSGNENVGHREGNGDGTVCITCSDEGRVAEVRAVLADGRVEVLAAGQAEQIDGRLVEGLRPGDLVLVHAGVAVTTLSQGDSASRSGSGS